MLAPGSDSIRAIATGLSVALKVTWAIFVIVWIIGAFTSKRTVRRQSWASRLGIVAIAMFEYLLLFWAARYFGFANRRFLPDSPICLWIGLFMTIRRSDVCNLGAGHTRPKLEWDRNGQAEPRIDSQRSLRVGTPSDLHRPHVRGNRNSYLRRRDSKPHLNLPRYSLYLLTR